MTKIAENINELLELNILDIYTYNPCIDDEVCKITDSIEFDDDIPEVWCVKWWDFYPKVRERTLFFDNKEEAAEVLEKEYLYNQKKLQREKDKAGQGFILEKVDGILEENLNISNWKRYNSLVYESYKPFDFEICQINLESGKTILKIYEHNYFPTKMILKQEYNIDEEIKCFKMLKWYNEEDSVIIKKAIYEAKTEWRSN